ncbi:DNA recombination protein RmuC [Rhodococcus sp. NPDC127530]|uniref:DNA recombination protein RmuC n=1 Tax=unclassified Rhodococcus (in: high G+C Gram-positive bacteria) TaxID=192944 RepID=UPI0036439F1D
MSAYTAAALTAAVLFAVALIVVVRQGAARSADFRSSERELRRYRETFASSHGRGALGEAVLVRTCTSLGLREGVHFDTQAEISGSSHARPDLVLLLDGGRRLAVDSKCVIDHYWVAADAVAADNEPERDKALAALVSTIRGHAKVLAGKRYDRSGADLSGVVLFVPDDGVAISACNRDPALLHDLLSQGVFLAGPTAFAVIAAGAHLAATGRALDADLVTMQTTLAGALHAATTTIASFDRANKQFRDAFNNFVSSHRHLTECVSALNDLRGLSARTSDIARPKSIEPIPDLVQVKAVSAEGGAGLDDQLEPPLGAPA